jgi:predicted aspartyl protease
MPNVTIFNPKARYILIPIFVTNFDGKRRKFDALLDTGAPASEFSDEALQFAGLITKTDQDITLKSGLQTQKYAYVVLPKVEVCSHEMEDLKVYVSHFEESWGIEALIGLDFFRQFRTTIDYQIGKLMTEAY